MIVKFYGSNVRRSAAARIAGWLRLWGFITAALPVYLAMPSQRRRLLRRYNDLTDVPFCGLTHVDIGIATLEWSWGPIGGMRTYQLGQRQISPCIMRTVTIQQAGMRYLMAGPSSPTRAMLHACGCPLVRHAESCSTITARVIGTRRRCRRPIDVLRAIEAGDYGN